MTALLVGLVAAPAAAAADTQRVILGVTPDADRAAIVGDIGAWRPVIGLDAITVDVPADEVTGAFEHWKSDADVRFMLKDYQVHADADPGDSTSNAAQLINQVPGARTWTTGSPSVTVAVVDSGLTPNPDLPSDRITAGYDFVDGDTDPVDAGNHGTLIANLIAAQGGNGVGTTGICPQCQIMPVRVLKSMASTAAVGYASDVAAGIAWAADHGAKIVNVSASSPTVDPLTREAVAHAAAKNVLVVASAGHDATTPYIGYPAAIDSVVAVGSSGNGGLPNYYSNVNTAADQWVDVTATGVTYAMGGDGVLRGFSGTSGSTAVVSGAAALAYAIKPSLSAAAMHDAITSSASKIPGTAGYAAPVLDAARLLQSVGAADTTPPVVASTGLTDNELVGPNATRVFTPTVTDDHAIEHVDMLLDGTVIGQIRPWSRTLSLKAPDGSNGPRQIVVRAYDYAGRTSEKSTTVVFDTTPPTGAFVLPAAEQHVSNGYQVVVSSPEGGDLASVSLNGSAMLPPYPGYTNWTGSGGTSSNLSATLVDKAGNATTITRHVQLDNAGPTATGLYPGTGTRVRGTYFSSISGVADFSGIAYLQLYANGKLVGNDVTYPYGMSVRTGTSNGTMTLVWKLVDKLGNVTTYTRYPIVDNTAPTVSITKAPATKAKVKGTVKVYVSAKDSSGIARVELLINGKVVATDSTASYVLSVNSAKVAKSMKVQVRAYDKVGNVRYTATRTWTR